MSKYSSRRPTWKWKDKLSLSLPPSTTCRNSCRNSVRRPTHTKYFSSNHIKLLIYELKIVCLIYCSITFDHMGGHNVRHIERREIHWKYLKIEALCLREIEFIMNQCWKIETFHEALNSNLANRGKRKQHEFGHTTRPTSYKKIGFQKKSSKPDQPHTSAPRL